MIGKSDHVSWVSTWSKIKILKIYKIIKNKHVVQKISFYTLFQEKKSAAQCAIVRHKLKGKCRWRHLRATFTDDVTTYPNG